MSTLTKDLVSIGFNEADSRQLGDTDDPAIWAVSNTQAAGYALEKSINFIVSATASTAEALRLPSLDATPYSRIFIRNQASDPVKIFPATNEQIGLAAINSSITLNPYNQATFYKLSSTQWDPTWSGYNPSSGAVLGTPPNYTTFDSTGHQTFSGAAKPWDDLRIEPVARTSGANTPAFEKWIDDAAGTSRGCYLYSFDDALAASEKEIFFTMQLPHSWDGGPIQMHVHWLGAVADTTAAPRWGLEYAWKEPGAAFGDTTTIYTDGYNYTLTGADANVTPAVHYISKFATITPDTTCDGISSILVGRLFRNSSNAGDTYNATGATCALLYIDAHFQLARIGSTDEYTP
jgi:hypothetical protein